MARNKRNETKKNSSLPVARQGFQENRNFPFAKASSALLGLPKVSLLSEHRTQFS
jgi:hypothetical protein